MAQKNDTPTLVISLLLTLGLIGGATWWLTQRSPINVGELIDQQSSQVPTSPNLEPTPLNQTASPTQPGAENFSNIQNVPSGLFNYGGSTTWAPIRGEIDPVIQTVFPQFQLRYTEPLTGASGSATGIRMLLDNQLAFAQSSRSLRPEEYQSAQQRGFTLQEIPVAIEGIAIAVHPSLNVAGLTLDQLKDIYTGSISNWNQVGGPNLPIIPYSRQLEAGGTVEFFVENILGGASFANSVQFNPNTTQALRKLAETPGGIYYASAPEVVGQCTTKPIALGRRSDSLIPPYAGTLITPEQCPAQRNQINETALQNGQYPITRRLFVIIKQNGQVDQQAGEAYANLLLSNQGQTLLNQAGFVRIR